jgi:CO/xanthine dehydrogenase FAD-binding subunit
METGIREVHRPATLEEALRLLARTDMPAVPLYVAPQPPEGIIRAAAVVDVSHLGLDGVRATEAGISLGAAASLEAILRSAKGGTAAWALIGEACRTTAPSGIRAVASVGGAVLAGDASDLLLALLALDAACVVRGAQIREAPLAGFSPARGELLVEVRVPLPRRAMGAALERVARTPRDRSIVAAAAAIETDGETCVRARLALSGVAEEAMRPVPAERLLEGQRLTPERIAQAAAAVGAAARHPGDHLGSAEYRRAAGAAVARRAIAAAWERAVREARR